MNPLKRVFFYDGAEPSRLYAALHWAVNLLLLLLWCCAVGLYSLWFVATERYGLELFVSYLKSPLILALNILPVFAVSLLFFLIFNRMWPGVLAGGLLTVTLTYVNYFKLLARDDPLRATDIAYFFEAAKIAGNYNVSVTPVMALAYAAVLAAAAFAFFFMRARFRRALPRIACAAALGAACALLYPAVYAADGVYAETENLEVYFASGYEMSEYNTADQYNGRGLLYPLIHSASDYAAEAKGYTRDKARAILTEYADADIPAGKKVNFVSVMLEAYCDFSVYGDLFEFTTDPYEFYHELEAESVSGTLVTNIFAGGTIDTERCYITGSMDMYDYRAPAWSYARYFDGQGYFTQFCHPGYKWYYNRQNVMEYLGFRALEFYENRFTLPEGYGFQRDDAFFPGLAALYDEAAADGTPYFNFSVTYQNHGPYAAGFLYDEGTEYLARGTLSEESYNILNNYFWGVRLTDGALRDFVGRLRERDEPVVLVLFGDHKPWLGDNGSVYDELGIDISVTSEESFYNRCCTQYLIWANGAAREVLGNDFTGEGPSLSPGFLMMEVFDLCGYTGPAYTQAERELFETVDVVNYYGLFRENGVLTDSLSEEVKPKMYKVWYLQYYLAHEWAVS